MKSTEILDLMVQDHTQLMRYLNNVEGSLESDSSILHQAFNTFQWNLEKHFFVEETMSELIWCWRKGNKTIYTKRLDIAQKAKKEGLLVTVLRNRSHIFRD